MKHDVGPWTEEIPVVGAVGIGDEQRQRADSEPPGAGECGQPSTTLVVLDCQLRRGVRMSQPADVHMSPFALA